MPAANFPASEAARLRSLKALNILDSAPEEEFDALVKTAAIICGVPISAISLIDTDRQWFKASVGLDGVTQTSREQAFCAHAILGNDVFEVHDVQLDPRFSDNKLVTEAPNIRFYAGAPLILRDGSNVGTLCVIDRIPRKLEPGQREALKHLSLAVSKAMEARYAAQELIVSQKRLLRHFEQAPVMMHSINTDGRITIVNDLWLATLGYDRSEVVGKFSHQFLTPESAHRAKTEILPQFFITGRCENIPYQMVCKSGQLIDILLSATLEREASGNFSSIAVIEDVTARVNALRESNSLIDAVQSQFIVAIIDPQGKFIEVNDAFCQLTGYSRDELKNRTHKIAQKDSSFSEFYSHIWEQINSGQSWRGEVCSRNKAGELYWVDCSISPLFDDHHHIDRFISFSVDITERIKQSAVIQSVSERMMLATNSGGIGVWDFDLVAGELNWDGWMYRLYGMQDAVKLGVYELWGDGNTRIAQEQQQEINVDYAFWMALIHPDDRLRTEYELQEAMKGNLDFNTEFRILWRDGSVHTLRASAVLTKNEQGQAIRMVGANWDVTQLRELSETLAQHDELMRVTLMSITDAVITTDSDSKVTWLNRNAEQLCGWTSEQAQGLALMQIFQLVNQETRQPIADPVQDCLRGVCDESVNVRHLLISKDGREYGVEDSAAPIRNELGLVLGAVLVFRDVTEIRLHAEKVKLDEERFNLAVNGANDGLWDIDLVNSTFYYSPRWKSMLGYEADDFENASSAWDTLVHPEDKIGIMKSIDACLLSTTDRFSNEYRMRHKAGHYVWILDRGLIKRNVDGKPIRLTGFHSDISEQKQVDKLKSEFISTVSHELRTPLTSIAASLGLLEAGVFGELPARSKELVHIANKNSKRLTTLVNDILDMEKLLSGTAQLHSDDIDMVEVIKQSIVMNAEYAASYGVNYLFTSLDKPQMVLGDKDRLMQVMANLMSNAAKFSPTGVAVEIRISVSPEFIRVEVQDYGPGVPINFRTRIFSEFAQADSSNTRQQGGTGLGLNITKKLVTKMGGEIGYDTMLGEGTVFWFTVPTSRSKGRRILF